MAGGIDWFRWHHGSVTDPKFQLVARKAGASLPDVLAIWAYMLEQASASEARGEFGDIDCEALDCMFAFPDDRTREVFEAMKARGLHDGARITAWEKRQPKRERTDDNSTARVQAFREKQRQAEPCNATERQETPRGEESREEETTSLLAQAPTPLTPSGPQLALVDESSKPKGPPDCPHKAVLELWAEVLPSMPQHLPAHWRGARSDHLRARWRETAIAERWQSEADGLQWMRKLFVFVGRSPFLTGRAPTRDPTKRPFVVELEWLVNPTNWAKVHEGKYHEEAA